MMSDPSIHHSPPGGLRQFFTRRNGIAWGMLVFTLLVQLVVWQSLRANEDRAAQEQFQMLGEKVTEAIRKRLRDHEQILLGGAGLFDAVEQVSREQWRLYVERLALAERYPGIQGVGFTQAIRPAERAAHVARIRSQGFADYDIHPAGERELYTSIIFLEPFSGRNLAAFGYDMYAEPIRQQAMQRAAQLGETSITGKVTLVQETHGTVQAGVLLYVPVYRPHLPTSTPDERMQALLGFVYSPYRVDDLMRGILRAADLPLALHIYASADEAPEHLLHASREAPAPGSARYSALQRLELYGQTWTLRMDSRPEFEDRFHANEALVFGLGLGLSLLVFFLTSSLALRHGRAQALAEARRVLTANRWQGNVRELENTIHRSVLMAQGDEIGPDAILTPDGDRLDLAKTAPAVAHATLAAEQVTRALVGRTVADVERDLILETLKHCLGNRTHAANILGISIRTLRNKLNEYADEGTAIPAPQSGVSAGVPGYAA